jgi:SRSO17 transposase
VPEGVIFSSKPQIALCLVDLSREWEVPSEVVVADSGYGKYPSFLGGLEEREVSYVCAVESTFGVRLPEEVVLAEEAGAPPYNGMGRPPKQRPAPLYTAEEAMGSVPDEAWRELSWREGTKGTLSKRMARMRVHRATGGAHHTTSHSRVSTGPEGWLIAERPSAKGEPESDGTKYYFSTLDVDASLERLAALAHSRWAIEQFYEDAKGECGLSDYQGRRWDSLHRHLALSMVAYSFLMLSSSTTVAEEDTCSGSFSPLGGKAHDSTVDRTRLYRRSTGRFWCGFWRTWCCGSSKPIGSRPSVLVGTNEVVLEEG